MARLVINISDDTTLIDHNLTCSDNRLTSGENGVLILDRRCYPQNSIRTDGPEISTSRRNRFSEGRGTGGKW